MRTGFYDSDIVTYDFSIVNKKNFSLLGVILSTKLRH